METIDKNSLENNKFTNFTFKNYINLLKQIKGNWLTVSYEKIPWEKKFILWRHDIDISLNRALKMAYEEYKLEIKATYFINIRSNITFEINIIKQLKHMVMKLDCISIHLHFKLSRWKHST